MVKLAQNPRLGGFSDDEIHAALIILWIIAIWIAALCVA